MRRILCPSTPRLDVQLLGRTSASSVSQILVMENLSSVVALPTTNTSRLALSMLSLISFAHSTLSLKSLMMTSEIFFFGVFCSSNFVTATFVEIILYFFFDLVLVIVGDDDAAPQSKETAWAQRNGAHGPMAMALLLDPPGTAWASSCLATRPRACDTRRTPPSSSPSTSSPCNLVTLRAGTGN